MFKYSIFYCNIWCIPLFAKRLHAGFFTPGINSCKEIHAGIIFRNNSCNPSIPPHRFPDCPILGPEGICCCFSPFGPKRPFWEFPLLVPKAFLQSFPSWHRRRIKFGKWPSWVLIGFVLGGSKVWWRTPLVPF